MSEDEALLDDWIHIHDLKIMTRIGVHAWEQRINQTLLISLACGIHLPPRVASLAETLDYSAVSEAVIQFVQTQSFQLIETVAEQVAQLVLEQFQVKKIKVTVTKPHAIQQARGVSVSLDRSAVCKGRDA